MVVIFTLTEISIKLIVCSVFMNHTFRWVFFKCKENLSFTYQATQSKSLEILPSVFLENSFQHFTTLRSLYYSCGYTCSKPSLIFVHHKCFIIYFLIFRGFTVLMKNKMLIKIKLKYRNHICESFRIEMENWTTNVSLNIHFCPCESLVWGAII